MYKKTIKILLFIIIGVLLSGFSFKDLSSPLYDNIKEQANTALKELFHRDVKIREVSGRVIGQIVLHGVEITPDLKAEIVKINFNPIKFAQNNGNMVPAITSIDIEQADATITRDRNNNVDIVNLFVDPNAKNDSQAEIPIKAKINIKNSKIKYIDHLGIYDFKKDAPYKFDFFVKSGSLDLNQAPKLIFKIDANQDEASAKASGWLNIINQKYKIKINAKNLSAKTWGPFSIPLELSGFDGQADLKLEISENKLKIDTNGKINGSTIKVSGTLNDFLNPQLDFSIKAKDAPLKDLKNQDLRGSANADIKISGSAKNPTFFINLEDAEGTYFNQSFVAAGKLTYKDDLLSFAKTNIKAYDGNLEVKGTIDFKNTNPKINLGIIPSKINLDKLAQRAPGISGNGSGILVIKGNSKNFIGSLKANLTNANVLGQAVESADGIFNYNSGNISIQRFGIFSESGHIKGSGYISKNLETTLSTEAKGILISGENFTGKLQAFIKSFSGSLSFKLDQAFARAPIRNLTASGSIEIENGKIAEQEIDYGRGEISVSSGQINITQFIIRRNNSTLTLFGKTGINTESNLMISGKKLDLEDLKIINLALPYQLRNPKGIIDIDFRITGFLNSETKLTSFVPFLDLTYNGSIKIIKAELQGTKINSAQAEIKLMNRKLSIQNAKIIGNKSILEFNFDFSEKKLELTAKGEVDFADFNSYLIQFGDIKGKGNFNLKYKEDQSKTNPEASFNINLSDVSFEDIFLGKLKTNMLLSNGKLSFTEPLVIESPQNKYELGGTTLLKDEKLNLYLKIHKSDLKEIMPLGIKIFNIVGSKTKTNLDKNQKRKIVLPSFLSYLTKGEILLYDDKGKNYLSSWEAIVQDLKNLNDGIPAFWEELSGKLRGELKISGNLKKPLFGFAARLDDAYFKKYRLNTIEIQGNYASDILNILRAQIIKAGGFFEIRGKYDTKKESANLNFKALSMPTDLLELIGENKKEYKGRFNLDGYLNGSIKRPTASLSLEAKDIVLAGIEYNKISTEVSLKDNIINIGNLSLLTGKDISSLDGQYSLEDQKISLDFDINGKGLGIINILNDEISFKDGKTKATLSITGKPGNLSASGFFELSDATIKLNKLDSELKNLALSINANGNKITLNKFTSNWSGKATKYRNNHISLSGEGNLKTTVIDLSAEDTNLVLDLNGYSGVVFTKDIGLVGPIDNLLLSGKIYFIDGVINLSDQIAGKKGSKTKTPPTSFNLELNFGKNMYITSGNMETFDLSNLFMSLEFSGEEVFLFGNSDKPELSGRLDFKRGTINIFNRDFTLLPETSQKKYYPFNFDRLSPNYALFSKEYGQFPYLNLTGDIVVEDIKTIIDPISGITKKEKKKVYIVSKITGVFGSTDSTQALRTNFEAFEENTNVQPSQMSPTNYSDTEIKVLLLPEFVKSIVGISGENIESSDVLADYLDSRLQVVVFRNVEREVERALGLESLTLQYNFGKDIRRSLGREGYQDIQPLYGIGFVKGFFDRLYVNVKYSKFDTDYIQGEGVSVNYEISYKLSPSLAIAYYREPLTYSGIDTDYYKLTLNNTVRF